MTTATAEAKVDIERLQRRDAHLCEIEQKKVIVKKLKDKYLSEKDACLKAKKAFDEASNELLELIEEGTDPQKRLPGMSALSTPVGNGAPKQQADDADDAWKKVSVIEGVGATGKMAELLAENGIANMGQFVEADGKDEVRKIKGIGEKKYEGMKEAMVKFLSSTRDKNLSQPSRATSDKKPATIWWEGREYRVERWMGDRAVVKTSGNHTKTLKPSERGARSPRHRVLTQGMASPKSEGD